MNTNRPAPKEKYEADQVLAHDAFVIFFRYGAKIVDVQAKLRPKIAEEKEKYIQTIVAETTETAIEQVKKKLKDAAEAAAEAARQEAGMCTKSAHVLVKLFCFIRYFLYYLRCTV